MLGPMQKSEHSSVFFCRSSSNISYFIGKTRCSPQHMSSTCSPQHRQVLPTTYTHNISGTYVVGVCGGRHYMMWVYVVGNKGKTVNVLHNISCVVDNNYMLWTTFVNMCSTT